MARQVLDNGVILPSEYSDDWYDDMTSNLTKLDEVIGSDAEKLSASDVGDAAISNDYEDLDDKPAYNILRRASVTLTAGGTGNYTDLDSDSKIKAGDYVLDAANKLYSITAIDNANSTYTVSAAAIINITDKSELGAAALSNSYDDLNNLPSYGITRLVNTAITDNSNVAFANISSVSKIAAGDFLLDTAGKMYLIASVDTVNETAAVTTPLTQLAVDSSVVHNSGNETIGGNKTFSDGVTFNNVWTLWNNSSVTKGTIPQSTVTPYRLYFGSGPNYASSLFNIDTSVSNTGVQSFTFRSAENVVSGDDAKFALIYDPNRTQPRYLSIKGGIEPNASNTYDCGSSTYIWKGLYGYHGYFCGQQQGDEYSGNARTNLTLTANRDTLGQSGCVVDTFRENTSQGTGTHIIGFGIKENSVRYEGCRFSWLYDDENSGYVFALRPTTQGTNRPIKYELGGSTSKWTTVNGLNPGSLSLPDLNKGIDISGYLTPGNSDNAYTPLVDGFVTVSIGIASGGCAVFLSQGDMYNACYSATGAPNASGVTAYCMLPVRGGVQMNIGLKGSNNYINSAKFFPCLGNV